MSTSRALPHALLAGTVALPSAVLSFDSVRRAAVPYFGSLAPLAPLMADGGAAGFALWYVQSVRSEAPQHALRLASHLCVGITVTLNVLSAHSPSGVLWHGVPPVLWSVLVELYARHFTNELKARRQVAGIPLRLWLTSPLESARVWLVQARKVSDPATRAHVGAYDAAHLLIDQAAGRRISDRRALRAAHRQLRTGAVDAAQVLRSLDLRTDGMSPALRSSLALLTCSSVPAHVRSSPARAQRSAVTAQLTDSPAQPAHGPAHAAQAPAQPAHGPAQPAHGPAQPAHGPAHAAHGPAQLTDSPAHAAQPSREALAREYLLAHPGASGSALAARLGCSTATANRLKGALSQ
ncbi:MAG: DUF2637 domain-containing protein [Dermatophilaceae bacterium]